MTHMRWGPRLMRTAAFVAGLVLASTAGAGKAHAAPLPPGGVVVGGTNYTNEIGYTFVVLDSRTEVKTEPILGLNRTDFRTAVVRNTTTGFLDFYYQMQNDSPAGEFLRQATMANFAGFATDVGYRYDGGDLSSIFTNDLSEGGSVNLMEFHQADRNGAGSVIGFQYELAETWAGLAPGETTVTMVIKTNAQFYKVGNFSSINGGTNTVLAFAPTVVPEPASMLLAGAGLAPLAGLLKRRRRSSETEETEEVA